MTAPTLRRNRGIQAGQRLSNKPEEARQAPSMMVPFTRAARQKTILCDDRSVTLTAGIQPLPPIDVPSAGFARFIDLDITLTTAGNAAAVTFVADAPWSVIDSISLTNAGGDSIIVPISGYQLYLVNKYGGFQVDPPYSDPRRDPYFSTTTGAGATGGSARFRLRVPLEIDPRDAFCALPNGASNKQYKMNIQLAGSASVYGVAPTNLPTVRINSVLYYWTQPNPQNAVGIAQQTEPLANGSVSLIRYQSITTGAGDKLEKIQSVGNIIRSAILVLRTAAGARSEADLAATNSWVLNNDTMFYLPLAQWRRDMAEHYGLSTATAEIAGGPDNGVLVWSHLNAQHGKVRADGPRDQWLPTIDGTLLQLRAQSFGATASRLEVITLETKVRDAAALYSLNVV